MDARCPIPEMRKCAQVGPSLDLQRKLSALHSFLATLKASGIDLFQPCGRSNGVPYCWTGSEVLVLNGVLLSVSLELREDSPGVLSLVSLVALGRTDLSDSALTCAVFLVYWLLCYHRCVRTVHLDFDAVLCLCTPAVVAEALRRGPSVSCLRLDLPGIAERTHNLAVLTSALGSMVSLEMLDIQGVTLSYVSVGGIVAALKSGRLRALVLGTCPQGKKVALRLSRALRKCTSLLSLTINGRARSLAQSVSQQTFLGQIPSLLQTNMTLRSLSLSGVTGELVGKVLRCLARNDTLNELCLSDAARGDMSVPVGSIYEFTENRHLRVLKLTQLKLGDAAAMAFAELLIDNVTLEEVDFSGSSVGTFGAHALAKALCINRSLKTLCLERSSLTEQSVELFARALSLNDYVEKVSLGNVFLPEQWCVPAEICDFNKLCGRLEVTWNTWGLEQTSICLSTAQPRQERIKLCWNRLATIASVGTIFAAASSLSFLNEVVVGNIHSDVRGFSEAIAGLLVSTKTLKKLEIRELFATSSIVIAILNALARNSTVCSAYFSCSLSDVEVVNALMAALNTNVTLHCVKFRGLYVRNMARFVRGIEKNDVLTDFSFDGIPDKEDVQDLWRLLWRNRCILSRAVKHVQGISVDEEAFSVLAGRDSLICALVKVTGKTSSECSDIVRRMVDKRRIT